MSTALEFAPAVLQRTTTLRDQAPLTSGNVPKEYGASTIEMSSDTQALGWINRRFIRLIPADIYDQLVYNAINQAQAYPCEIHKGSTLTFVSAKIVVGYESLANSTNHLTPLHFKDADCGGSGTLNADQMWREQVGSASTDMQMFGFTDALVADLQELRELHAGWDGEGAAAPLPEAIRDAMSFVRAAGDLARPFEPTPDVDGSILLEMGDGSEGSLRFRGDHTIVYAIRGVAPGMVRFDGGIIPDVISAALGAAQ
jgi:hypothetical protein